MWLFIRFDGGKDRKGRFLKMKKHKVFFLLGMLTLAFSLVLPGCSKGKTGAGGEENRQEILNALGNPIDTSKINRDLKGKVTHWVWSDHEKLGGQDFNKFYPNIEMEFVNIPDSSYEEKVMATFSSGMDLPDIVSIEAGVRGQWCNMDVWERLDAPPYNLDKSLLLPICIPLITNENGEIVCSQIDNAVSGFVYDRNLAKKYFGSGEIEDMEKIFSTVDAFIEQSRKVGAGGDFMFASAEDLNDCLGSLTRDPMTIGKKLNTDVTVKPVFEIVEKMVANKAIGSYTMWSPAWYTSFASNKVLFYEGPAWFISYFLKPSDEDAVGKWGLMTPPGGGYNRGGTAYGIPKKTKNKEVAWAFIKWLTLTQEGTDSFFAQGELTMYAPAYKNNTFKGTPDPLFADQDWIGKINEISLLPETGAPLFGSHDFIIRKAREQIWHRLVAGEKASVVYEDFVKDVLNRSPELSR
jgi:multiple sugar transport system substrate-binding protein